MVANDGAPPESRVPSSTAVTKVIDRIPRPDMTDQLEQVIKNVISAALRFPGHLGATVSRSVRAWQERKQSPRRRPRKLTIADRFGRASAAAHGS